MSENDLRNTIIDNLREHPEGLTIQSIAEITGINRMTVSKYVLVLSVEGTLLQRRIGRAKLCNLV